MELDDVYYMLSQKHFSDSDIIGAKKFVDEAISLFEGDEAYIKKEKFHLLYMRAKCCRVLGRYEEAEKDYLKMKKQYDIEEGKKIAKYIFGMILMPLETNRKKIMEFIEAFEGILDQYEGDKCRTLLIQHYLEAQDKNAYIGENENPKWLDK